MTSERADRDCAVLYCTHTLTDEIRNEYDRLSSELETGYDVILLLDQASTELSDVPPGTFKFSQRDVLREFGSHMERPDDGNLLPGCLDLAILHYAKRCPDYEYYWLIEHDVRFSGAWNHFFAAFEENDADLLSSLVHTRSERPEWPWWPTLSSPHWVNSKSVKAIRAFHPVCRISRTGLLAMEEAYARGWKGHYEVTLPTILHHKGYRIEDFGGQGSFVATGNTGRFYSNIPRANGLAEGSFVWRPCRLTTGAEPNKLWHPVKQCDEVPNGPQVAESSGGKELNKRSVANLIAAFQKVFNRRVGNSG